MNLKQLANEISTVYMQNKKVEAVMLGGSVSRNWDDEYSDIELFIFWKEGPTEEDRKLPISTLDGEIIDFHPYEEEEWSESYITNGVKLEISNFLTDTIEQIIHDVTVTFDTNLDKQCLVAAVHDGIALGGEGKVKQLKKKVEVYPEELSVAMIREHLDLGNRWNNREALLAREDWLMLSKVLTDVNTQLMGTLFGLNRLYVHHPAFKWQNHSLDQMKIIPPKAKERFSSIFLEKPIDRVREIELLIAEIYQLVQKEHANLDLSDLMNRMQFLRPKN
ncbi:DUF4037 domain-containing protein [Salinibacillus xinjiangensis]|uniref:DUF4037 domain-containing protein n=1 Tax=Salinibacillus xinjiangensis TaxID=1229268 RepID=A0A6G1X4T9_9BACI|nr:DUF4037 domain-containing protein [Salinibacillus xinjiangensis]MRG85939.1 DUF4037 domain-containing protein [Salinibacillus xinjiangensis]